jgi:hypothetical protein
MKPTSKSISALQKLKIRKMNLSSVKIPKKEKKKKKPCFFHLDVSSPMCKATTSKYSLV